MFMDFFVSLGRMSGISIINRSGGLDLKGRHMRDRKPNSMFGLKSWVKQ